MLCGNRIAYEFYIFTYTYPWSLFSSEIILLSAPPIAKMHAYDTEIVQYMNTNYKLFSSQAISFFKKVSRYGEAISVLFSQNNTYLSYFVKAFE